ncbi:hypothetical protein IEO21_08173 [Rhodonia placenta]|uniref:NADP-dependent oxidoreductase domain-containing protein n=1 Tax=Rhodonia placenta TaxID=104341 RepID=A0A8H7TYZ2_9APHY|nr:hypothetical protein IEO21_08173 [Postia placenta]
MSIGDQWGQYGMGEMNKDRSFRLLDAFYAAGGNFVDTANAYQDETSERFLGEWMAARGVRDQMVVATKGGQCSTNYKRATDLPQKSTYVGNNMKSLYLSVEASLSKLQTDYIDILYLHWWDWECSIEEVMNGLHHFVAQRKVLFWYAFFWREATARQRQLTPCKGVSDTPAWVVSKANTARGASCSATLSAKSFPWRARKGWRSRRGTSLRQAGSVRMKRRSGGAAGLPQTSGSALPIREGCAKRWRRSPRRWARRASRPWRSRT